MEPDVVEIAPPLVASGSRIRKPRKAVMSEVIDVEEYEFHKGKKNKGKAIQVGSYYDHNPFTQMSNQVMDVDDYTMFQDDVEVVMTTQPLGSSSSRKGTSNSRRSSSRIQATKVNVNLSLSTPSVPQSWDFVSGLVLPHYKQTQTPDLVMVPTPPSRPSKYDPSASSSRPVAVEVIPSTQEKFLRDFKRFDFVEDFSDHQYVNNGNASKQHTKNWVKKVQADWKILENDLPETVFVRACESRMDLLRAVIIGAEGTPYHDGLFFFDIMFPDTYPSIPPKVHYHAGGLRINPNLYDCGKVCLSLLGTWSGNAREKWLPKESTMLQLLVSIQALILNQKPYFNEPGYASSAGTQAGEVRSKAYSENVFVLSLTTMVYSMRRPPKHFEEFVRSHFYVRAHDIVKACNAYKDGAPLGSMVKGGVQDVEETSESGSVKFKAEVENNMKTVVAEFVKLGVKELEDKPKPPTKTNANSESYKANRRR